MCVCVCDLIAHIHPLSKLKGYGIERLLNSAFVN